MSQQSSEIFIFNKAHEQFIFKYTSDSYINSYDFLVKCIEIAVSDAGYKVKDFTSTLVEFNKHKDEKNFEKCSFISEGVRKALEKQTETSSIVFFIHFNFNVSSMSESGVYASILSSNCNTPLQFSTDTYLVTRPFLMNFQTWLHL